MSRASSLDNYMIHEAREKKINDAGEAAKKMPAEAIDDATNAAKGAIRHLPEKAQEAAANVFASGFKSVQVFWRPCGDRPMLLRKLWIGLF